LYVFQITYAELLQLFEYGMTDRGSRLISRVTGIDCYFTKTEKKDEEDNITYEYAVHSIAKDGITIYEKGTWTGDWASRSLTVALNSYIATTDRVDTNTGMHNPTVEWNGTSRLIINNLIDNENAVRVLKAEAENNNGLLSIDTEPHFILLETVDQRT
jgi:hypothetical protein